VPVLCVEHDRGQIELCRQFQCPLLTDGRWTDYQQPPLALGPELAQDDPCLDCLSEPDLVRKNDTLGKRRCESE
jgi:hypothetical protein